MTTNNHTALIEALERVAAASEHYGCSTEDPAELAHAHRCNAEAARQALADASIGGAEIQTDATELLSRLVYDLDSSPYATEHASYILEELQKAGFALTPAPPIGGEGVRAKIAEKLHGRSKQLATKKLALRAADDILAIPGIRAALSATPQSGWRDGMPPTEPECKAWLVHRDKWATAKITTYHNNAWWIDGNRYEPNGRNFDRHRVPLPLPNPQNSEVSDG